MIFCLSAVLRKRMKLFVVILALLGSSLATKLTEQIQVTDWSKIIPNDIHVEPLKTAPKYPVSRIIGGTEAVANSFPYQVALTINMMSFCGGSIISENWVLTAAHCVERVIFAQATFGAHNINNNEATQITITVREVNVHSEWNRETLQNDVAILSLSSAISYSSAIQPITLASSSSGNFVNSIAVLSGWGRTTDSSNAGSNVLRRVDLQILSNTVCGLTFGSIIQDNHICTSGLGIVGACNGDSGGPLVVNGVQVGIVSFGSSVCEGGNPTVFARVSHFREWITRLTGI